MDEDATAEIFRLEIKTSGSFVTEDRDPVRDELARVPDGAFFLIAYQDPITKDTWVTGHRDISSELRDHLLCALMRYIIAKAPMSTSSGPKPVA